MSGFVRLIYELCVSLKETDELNNSMQQMMNFYYHNLLKKMNNNKVK